MSNIKTTKFQWLQRIRFNTLIKFMGQTIFVALVFPRMGHTANSDKCSELYLDIARNLDIARRRDASSTLWVLDFSIPWRVLIPRSSPLRKAYYLRLIRERWPHLSVGAALYLANYLLSAAYTPEDFEQDTKEFDDYKKQDGAVAFVNTHAPDSEYYQMAKHYFRRKYGNHPDVYYVERWRMHGPLTGAMDQIKSEADLRGRPFDKIEIFDYEAKPGDLPSLPDSEWWGVEFRGKDFSKALAPNAKVRFIAGRLGRGEKGKKFLKKFGQNYMPNGGEIFASQVNLWRWPSQESHVSYVVSKIAKYGVPFAGTVSIPMEEPINADVLASRIQPAIKLKIPAAK